MPELLKKAPQKAPRSDRRRTGRFLSRKRNPCHLTRATIEGAWTASVRNISSRGIGLIASRPVKPGMLLTVELPATPRQPARAKLMKVAHAQPQPGTQSWLLGGQFVRELTREEVDALRARAPSLSPHDERRTQARHTTRVKTGARLVRIMEVGPWPATIRNVSASGISLITNRACKAGMLLTIEMQLADNRPRLLRVVHAKPQAGNGWWVVGAEFLTQLSKEELAALLR